MYNDRGLHELMGSYVYGNQTLWDFVKRPTYWMAPFFIVLLFLAVPKDRARRMVWRFGRRLRGWSWSRRGPLHRESPAAQQVANMAWMILNAELVSITQAFIGEVQMPLSRP